MLNFLSNKQIKSPVGNFCGDGYVIAEIVVMPFTDVSYLHTQQVAYIKYVLFFICQSIIVQ